MRMLTQSLISSLVSGALLFATNLAAEASAPETRKILQKEKRSPAYVFIYHYYLGTFGKEVKHGVETWQDASGRKIEEKTYVDGVVHGPSTRYASLGDVDMHGQYKHGRKDGPWKGIDRRGEVRSLETYVDGHLAGLSRFYMSGKVVREDEYADKGRKVTRTIFRDKGTKISSGTYAVVTPFLSAVKEVKIGTWTYWDPQGKVVAEGVWKNGRPWSGICGVPEAGDAGSAGGLENFGRYVRGKRVASAPHP